MRARLSKWATRRTRTAVLDEDGREVAEFADDVVRSVDHRTGQERTWREWEVELTDPELSEKRQEKIFKRVRKVLKEAGASRSTAVAKIARALGQDAAFDEKAGIASAPEPSESEEQQLTGGQRLVAELAGAARREQDPPDWRHEDQPAEHDRPGAPADRARLDDAREIDRVAGRLAVVDRLGQQRARLGTAFTVSIEAAEGVTTGISAADRARTVAVAINPEMGRRDIVTPGHVFPLIARDGLSSVLIEPDGRLSADPHTLYGDYPPVGPRNPAGGLGAIRLCLRDHPGVDHDVQHDPGAAQRRLRVGGRRGSHHTCEWNTNSSAPQFFPG